jgi:hypothetical protein
MKFLNIFIYIISNLFNFINTYVINNICPSDGHKLLAGKRAAPVRDDTASLLRGAPTRPASLGVGGGGGNQCEREECARGQVL